MMNSRQTIRPSDACSLLLRDGGPLLWRWLAAPGRLHRPLILLQFAAMVLAALSCERPDPFELVEVQQLDATIVVDLPYAGPDNFLGRPVYEDSRCFLRRCAAERLVRVQRRLAAQGFGLKIWDGYRPLSVQKAMWEIMPDPNFVANPARGSRHNRGAAVDVTLVDQQGRDVEMPTRFDEFSALAAARAPAITGDALRHRTLLQEAMTAEGFMLLDSEWWHFDDPEWKKCDILDISSKNLQKKRAR